MMPEMMTDAAAAPTVALERSALQTAIAFVLETGPAEGPSRRVCLHAADGSLHVSSWHKHLAATWTLAIAPGLTFQVGVDGQTLAGALATLDGLETVHVSAPILSGRAHLRLEAPGYRATFAAQDVAPVAALEPWPEAPAATLLGRDLIDAGDQVSNAVTADDARYFLHGAALIVEATTLTLVTTDGHRLHKAVRPLAAAPARVAETWLRSGLLDLIVALPRQAGARATIQMRETALAITIGAARIAQSDDSRPEQPLPPWRRVFEKTRTPRCVRVTAGALAMAVTRALAFASSVTQGLAVTCTPEGMQVRPLSLDGGALTAVVPAAAAGDPITFHLNGQYLLDVLAAFAPDDDIEIAFDAAETQLLFRYPDRDDFCAVLMPRRQR